MAMAHSCCPPVNLKIVFERKCEKVLKRESGSPKVGKSGSKRIWFGD